MINAGDPVRVLIGQDEEIKKPGATEIAFTGLLKR